MTQFKTLLSYFTETDEDEANLYFTIREGYSAEYSNLPISTIAINKNDHHPIICPLNESSFDITRTEAIRKMEIFRTERVF